MTKQSILKAIVVPPLAAIPPSLLFLSFEGVGKGSIIGSFGWIGTAILIYIIAVLGCALIGLPVHFTMQKMNMKGGSAYAIAGFFLPLIILAFMLIFQKDWHDLMNLQFVVFSLVFAIAGAAVALTLRKILE